MAKADQIGTGSDCQGRMTRRLCLFVLLATALASSVIPASAATEWVNWKVTGNGYCVVHKLTPLSALPATEGDLQEWSASSELCGSAQVSGLRLRATIIRPPECRFHHPGDGESSRYYTGGEVADTYPSAITSGAVTYFEAGDGSDPPASAIGKIVGATPEPVGIRCWQDVGLQFKLRSFVMPPGATSWVEVGTSFYGFDVLRHPNFALERPAQIAVDQRIVSRRQRHCGDFQLRLYDTDSTLRVGDLLEYASVGRLCDTAASPQVFGIRALTSFDPPAGCSAPIWMYERAPSSGGSFADAHSGGQFHIAYGEPDALQVPPDVDLSGTSGGGGRAAAVVPNCPGTWIMSFRLLVDETNDNAEGPNWRLVGALHQPFVVAPPVE